MSNPFKDTKHNWLINSLFWESTQHKQYPLYTLKDETFETPDGRHLPSIKQLYMECRDPTEHIFVSKHMGSWSQWKRIAKSRTRMYGTGPRLCELVCEWQEELEIALRSEGLQQIIQQAGTEKGFQAAKILMEAGWKQKKAGQPSKAAVLKEAKHQAEINSNVLTDAERIGLTLKH